MGHILARRVLANAKETIIYSFSYIIYLYKFAGLFILFHAYFLAVLLFFLLFFSLFGGAGTCSVVGYAPPADISTSGSPKPSKAVEEGLS